MIQEGRTKKGIKEGNIGGKPASLPDDVTGA